MKKYYLLFFALCSFILSCNESDSGDYSVELQEEDLFANKMVKAPIDIISSGKSLGSLSKSASNFSSRVSQINAAVAEHGIQLSKMEFYSANGAGQTVFFSDRGNKQLDSDYVPNDPRNETGEEVPYLLDGTELITRTGYNTAPALLTVRETWENVTCSSGLNVPLLGATPFDIGYVQWLVGFGGIPGFFPGTIVQAGVLPSTFFDAIEPGGGQFILGVTFTFTWLDDINADGKGDVAIKEVYYNDGYVWSDDPTPGLEIDFETVALHETGHALSQAHFGKVSRTDKNGKIHFSPRAVMNAGYSGVNRVIAKTDRAGHCSNWGNWPNN